MTALHVVLLGITPPDALAHLRTLQQLPEVAAIHLWDPDGEALAPNGLHVRSTNPACQDEAPIRKLTYPGNNSPAPGDLPGKEFVRDFIRAAQGQDQAWTSSADARYVAQVVDVAYESSRSGQRIIIKGRVDEASAR